MESEPLYWSPMVRKTAATEPLTKASESDQVGGEPLGNMSVLLHSEAD